MSKYNRTFARRRWRASFGAGMFKRRLHRSVNDFGDVTQKSSWQLWREKIERTSAKLRAAVRSANHAIA